MVPLADPLMSIEYDYQHSAVGFCGDDFRAQTFSDLCGLGQFFLLLHVLLIPVITFGNTLIIVTITLVKTLHTPHDYCIYYLAMVDFIIGLVYTPVHLVFTWPESAQSLRSVHWPCSLWVNAGGCLFSLAFDFLTIMCADRLLMTFAPVWRINHVKKRTVILAHLAVAAVRSLMHVGLFVHSLVQHAGGGDHVLDEDCGWDAGTPQLYFTVTFLFLIIEIAACWCMCIAVVIKVFRLRRAHRIMKHACFRETPAARQQQMLPARDSWHNVALVCSLILVFLVLWTPFPLSFLVPSMGINKTMAIAVRLVNSAVNAPIYAATRPDYRWSFTLLLCTAPWRWNTLPRRLKIHKSNMSLPAADRIHEDLNSQTSMCTQCTVCTTTQSRRCSDMCRESVLWNACLTCLGKENVADGIVSSKVRCPTGGTGDSRSAITPLNSVVAEIAPESRDLEIGTDISSGASGVCKRCKVGFLSSNCLPCLKKEQDKDASPKIAPKKEQDKDASPKIAPTTFETDEKVEQANPSPAGSLRSSGTVERFWSLDVGKGKASDLAETKVNDASDDVPAGIELQSLGVKKKEGRRSLSSNISAKLWPLMPQPRFLDNRATHGSDLDSENSTSSVDVIASSA